MIYNQQLIDIIKKKQFKSFFSCLDYLLIAGYSKMDAFGITMKEFGSDKMFTNVAFIRFNFIKNNSFNPYSILENIDEGKNVLTIGLIDDTNIHLSSIYELYIKKLSIEKYYDIQIENTCEIIQINDLIPLISEYVLTIADKYFNLNLLEKLKKEISENKKLLIYKQPKPVDMDDWVMGTDPASRSITMMNRVTGEVINRNEYDRR